jgi:peptidoglycan/LPS O-acetylase OafA/YrhL
MEQGFWGKINLARTGRLNNVAMELKNNLFIPQLNALRFLAAILVVVFHFGRWSQPFNTSLSGYSMTMNLAVSFFFVLSGFIMVIIYKNLKTFSWSGLWSFYKKRARRIFPLYIIALILVSVECFLIKNVTPQGFSLKYFFENLFFLQSWIPKDALTLNFPGWSLSVEMFFYLLFPFLLPLFYPKNIR